MKIKGDKHMTIEQIKNQMKDVNAEIKAAREA